MKLRLIIVARLLIIVCAILAYKGYQQIKVVKVNQATADSELISVESDVVSANKAFVVFSGIEKDTDYQSTTANEGITRAVVAIKSTAILTGIKVESLTADAIKNGPKAEGAEVVGALTPIPFSGGSLNEVKFKMKLQYADLDGLKAFLDTLPSKRIRLQNLSIDGNNATVSVGYLAS